MSILLVTLLILIIIALISFFTVIILKLEKENKIKVTQTLQDVLDAMGFYPSKICYVNRHLSIALNKKKTKIGVIKNFNPNNPSYYSFQEIALSFIEKIEKNVALKVHYICKGEIRILNIHPSNKTIENFIHEIFEMSLVKKIQDKFSQHRFTSYSSSDWECSYFWAYSKFDNTFAYLKTDKKMQVGKVNLKKEFITIDTNYKYLEVPVFGIAQQLYTYNSNFLNEVFSSLFNTVKDRYSEIAKDSIYYDNYSNIAYLTNGINAFQSIIIDEINNVEYQDNRIILSLIEKNRRINYISNQQQITEFENFVIDYNLKKIAQSFNYKTDKLVNTTKYTKFIIDITRNRVIYCANLNKISNFSYIILSLSDLKSLKVEKSGMKYFLRISTKENEIIDVTCDKKEVAQYIEAQINKFN